MTSDHADDPGPEPDDRLMVVLDAYLQAVESGQSLDRTEWLAQYPDLAEELTRFLDEQDRLMRLTEPLRPIAQAASLHRFLTDDMLDVLGDGTGEPRESPRGGESPRDDALKSDTVDGGSASKLHEFSDYVLIEPIAHGGMGTVFKARQRSLNRIVAVKLVRGGALAGDDDRKRFRQEAEAVAALDHPNIVSIYEVGEHDGFSYFSMKLAGGGSLAQRLHEYTADPRSAAKLVATVARAIHHAHERGILHRDLKPSNIVIDDLGQPQVSDFGLAKRLEDESELTQSGTILGTPSYMAPEQASGKRGAVATATDVYGLGAVLYTLLVGRPPFRGDSVLETIEEVKKSEPEPPSGVNRRVDRDLETTCLKCLEKEPERRYASALALAEDLERWLRGEPIAARPLSRPVRLQRWAWRRRRWLAAGVATLVMLVLIGLGMGQALRLRRAGKLVLQQERVIRGRDEEARRAQYASDIRGASALIAHGEAKEARELLDRRIPGTGAEDFRGFEWFYLRGLIDTWRKSWVGHEGKEVYHVEYAPDGRTFATAGQDRAARIWDAETGQERLVLRGHEDEVDWVSFDPSGTRLVTAGDDASVRIWSASDGKVSRVLDRLPSPAVAALFTPDGRDVIAAARDGTVVRWDAATGGRRATSRVGRPRDKNSVETLAISPHGTTLALAGKETWVVFFDLSHDGLTAVTGPAAGMPTNGLCVAFAPDGRSLAATGVNEVHAILNDPATGKRQGVLEGPAVATFTLAFAPNGRTLAVGYHRGALRIWDLATRSCQVSLLGHTDRIWCVAFAPDGRTLATTSRDGTIRIWDATGRADRIAFRGLADPYGGEASSVAFSADGTQLLAANEAGGVLACNLRDGTARTLRAVDKSRDEGQARLAPDGSAVVVTEGIKPFSTITSADRRWKSVVYDLSGSRGPISLPVEIRDTVPLWSPDGKRLVLIDPAGDLTLWDRISGRLVDRVAFGFGAGSSDAAFLPAGDVVIACCGDDKATPRRPYQLVVWNPARSQLDRQPMPIQDDRLFGKIVLAPDGRNLADLASGWPGPCLWDLATLLRRFQFVGHSDRVTDVAFAPDGRTLATASVDRTVRLWSVASGQELLVLEGHTGAVRVVAFSPDGRMLASCGDLPGGGIEAIVWRAVGWDRAKLPATQPLSKED
ncbi:MAG: protein kinase domain-containing protein [Isosphaeraceae bacterium]